MRTSRRLVSSCLVLLALTIISTASCDPHYLPFRVALAGISGRNNASKSLSTTPKSKAKSSPLTTSPPRGGVAMGAAAKTISATQRQVLNLLSGGAAGTVAAFLTNPLEVIKTQLQSSSTSAAEHGKFAAARGHPISVAQEILVQDGIPGFFRGLPATLIGIIPARSAYFYAYEQSKKKLGPFLPEGSPGNALLSGLAAGIAGNTLTNPIWMVRTRMQLLADSSAGQRVYSGYRDAIATIAKEEGIAGFYKGIFASYWGCVEGSIQFLLYEQIKTKLLERTNRRRAQRGMPPTDRLTRVEYFCSAAFAKTVASIGTYPHEVARTRLREQARGGIFKYHGMWQTIRLIGLEEGRAGLYAGMGVHLMKVVPNSAIMFLSYEIVNRWLDSFVVVNKKEERLVAAGKR